MSTLHFLPRGHDDPLTTLSLARVLLDSVRAGRRPGALRIYRPEPTVVFGGRDRFLAGFDDAVGKALEAGFTPLLRTLGGRVAAYHHGSLVIDHVEPADQMFTGTQARFTSFGDMYVRALQSVGVDARLGEIPGEYCPGEHSVNVAGKIKAIGTAQRVTKTGWLFSSSVIVTDPAPIRSVLTDVEAALGVDWDPATGGSISEIHPDVTVDAVEQAFLTEYARGYDLEPSEFSAEEIEAAGAYNSVSDLSSTQ